MIGTEATSGLIGAKDIAKLAGLKTTSAVSNWRKRHSSFPKPRLETPSGALFDFNEVEDWLLEEGKIKARVPARQKLLAQLDNLRGLATPGEMVEQLRALIVFLVALRRAGTVVPDGVSLPEIESSNNPGKDLAQAARLLTEANPELDGLLRPLERDISSAELDRLAGLLRSIDESLDDEDDPVELLNTVTLPVAGSDRSLAAHATPASVVKLVSSLANSDKRSTLDPAMGGGSLLYAVSHSGVDRALGYEIDSRSVLEARSRFFVGGLPLSTVVGNALDEIPRLEPVPQSDLVVVDPPFGLGKWGTQQSYRSPFWSYGEVSPRNADFCWIQLATLLAAPEGQGYCLSPAGTTFRAGPEEAIRKRMVDAGVIEAIIALPPRLRIDVSIPTVLWVLRSSRSGDPETPILMVDATGLGDPGRMQTDLPSSAVSRITGVVAEWRTSGEIAEENQEIAAAVSPGGVKTTDLSPSTYIHFKGPDREALMVERGRLLDQLDETLPLEPGDIHLEATEPATGFTETESLAALCDLLRSKPLKREDRQSLFEEPGEGLVGLIGHQQLDGKDVQYLEEEIAADKLQMIKDGDIIFTIRAGEVQAMLADPNSAGLYLGPNAWLLRTKTKSAEPAWIYCLVRGGEIFGPVTRRKTMLPSISKRELEDINIPLPPLPEQQAIGAQLLELEAVARRAQTVTETLKRLLTISATLSTPEPQEHRESHA